MKLYGVALLVLLSACAALDKKERAVVAPPAKPAVSRPTPVPTKPAPPIARAETAEVPPVSAPVSERSSSTSAPAASRPRPQVGSSNGARKPDGVAAPRCVVTRRVERSPRNIQVYAKNECAFAVEVKAACLPTYAEPNEPYPGTYALDSWLFTLGDGQEQAERQSAMCFQRGGKVLYASCQSGIPYFTSRDGTKYGCFR